ncbi:hypothetical protein [Pseudomonas sp. Sample_16]|uniref:hypothetical protein n=1 Tax=Pseudomonas sp. Sample_16 TaxID=2448263 RepID=UPI001032DCF5|nr:hypothetical protein [Pseudomonas sp. Sample_16]
MADEWSLSIKVVDDKQGGINPVAVVDWRIQRRLLLSLSDAEGLKTSLKNLGLPDLYDLLKKLEGVPKELLKFTNIPWTACPSGTFDTDSVIEILNQLRKGIWYRLEGAPSELKGVISNAGFDVVFDMREENLNSLYKRAVQCNVDLDKALGDAKDDAEKSSLEAQKKMNACITASLNADGEFGPLLYAAWACHEAEKARKEAEEAQRNADQAQEEVDRTKGTVGRGDDGGAGGSGNLGKLGGAYSRFGG